ncbi:hypothetical protein J4212_03125 [Candidatus Woesearchaeota archaeon]|nr:hypothetical protein [Candidatus Woesearchaeota archaeon]
MAKSEVQPIYRCETEVRKPSIFLSHEPGLETLIAVENSDHWGFDPSLKKDPRSPELWLEDGIREHKEMVSVLRGKGIEILYLRSLLEGKKHEIKRYILNEFYRIRNKLAPLDRSVKKAIDASVTAMMDSLVSGVLLGLESGRRFREMKYSKKREVYCLLETLMPQTSIYFTQDPVISTPNGLVKAQMAMPIRRQEPDIMQIALGKKNYIHELGSTTEGGDITMCSSLSYAAGGDVRYVGGTMLFGVSAQSGKGIEEEIMRILKKSGVNRLFVFYMPNISDSSLSYAGGNVMHLDTIMMPIADGVLLANVNMLKKSRVSEGIGGKLVNGYHWARKNFERVISVPDREQQGTYGWGSNVLPLGNMEVLSSTHLRYTNKNLREAGFDVIAINAATLTSGFGSFHCMTAYLMWMQQQNLYSRALKRQK